MTRERVTSVGSKTKVTCLVRDLGDGKLRATGVLNLTQQFPK
jgi:hypothetical protein